MSRPGRPIKTGNAGLDGARPPCNHNTMQDLSERSLLGIVADRNRPCIERGAAIDRLSRRAWSQQAIAGEVGKSKADVSHLRTCFRNLKGKAREMCRTGRMNGDACYSLARETSLDQQSVLEKAIEIRRIRDARNSELPRRLKGRRTPVGQVTDKDVKEAIAQLLNSTKNDAWPAEVLAAIGAFPDFPELAELRRGYAPEKARESLD